MDASRATSDQGSVRFSPTIGASALSGALLLDCIFLVLSLSDTPPSRWLTADALIGPLYFGTTFGAMVGGIVGPLLRYTLLRRVPASRAIAWSVMGTTAGLAAGAVIGWYWLDGAAGLAAIKGAAIALLGSSLFLWWRHQPPTANVAR